MKAEAARFEVLNPVGEPIGSYEGEKTREGVRFKLTGEFAGANYILHIDKKTVD